MTNKSGYIPKAERKNILLLCDDIRMHSGIATMAREIVTKSAHRYNWYNLGAAIKHPEFGKVLNLSDSINKATGIEDSQVFVQPNNGYGDVSQIRDILANRNIDAILIFTDPRYWTWLFDMEREIRSTTPMFYLNIWDDYPTPLWNRKYYASCDLLMAISKQTKNINELSLKTTKYTPVIKYVPHGIDHNVFKPLDKTSKEYKDFRTNLFDKKDIDYVVFFNSRNINRKRPGDVILSYRIFCDLIGKEKAKKCALVLHTQPSDPNGTDLRAVKEALCDPEYVNVYFSTEKLSPEQMNLMYNIADSSMLISSNEGWGLSLTESMMAGTMIVANVTGGMQDQMRFVDDKGEWYTPSADIPSNHRGTFKEHGEWAKPVYPSNISLAGSPPTPYIFDDRCDPDDVAIALKEIYELPSEDRIKRGLKGREWAMSDEAKMTAEGMVTNVMDSMDEAFDKFTPRDKFDLLKVEDLEPDYIQHKITGY
jgi:glycosyltransferase involved in cell wall biosynthesis